MVALLLKKVIQNGLALKMSRFHCCMTFMDLAKMR
jgi:hypothetical protein